MRDRPVFSRFRELNSDALNVEYQVHTIQTDGEGTVEEILSFAQERGIGALAFTEHVRVATDWFPDFSSDIRERAAGFPEMRVFVGCETRAMDENGTLDISKEILEASDIVLGSVHRFPDGKGGYLDFKTLSADETADIDLSLPWAWSEMLLLMSWLIQGECTSVGMAHFRKVLQGSDDCHFGAWYCDRNKFIVFGGCR